MASNTSSTLALSFQVLDQTPEGVTTARTKGAGGAPAKEGGSSP